MFLANIKSCANGSSIYIYVCVRIYICMLCIYMFNFVYVYTTDFDIERPIRFLRFRRIVLSH